MCSHEILGLLESHSRCNDKKDHSQLVIRPRFHLKTIISVLSQFLYQTTTAASPVNVRFRSQSQYSLMVIACVWIQTTLLYNTTTSILYKFSQFSGSTAINCMPIYNTVLTQTEIISFIHFMRNVVEIININQILNFRLVLKLTLG